MKRPIIAITIGDPAGIGAEIAVKALGNEEIYRKSKPVVIGSRCVMEDALKFIPSDLKLNVIKNTKEIKGEFGTIDLIDLNNIKPVSYTHLRAHETDSYLVCRLLLE